MRVATKERKSSLAKGNATLGASILAGAAVIGATAFTQLGGAMDESVLGTTAAEPTQSATALATSAQAGGSASPHDQQLNPYHLAICEAVSHDCSRLRDKYDVPNGATADDLIDRRPPEDLEIDVPTAQLFLEGGSAELFNELYALRDRLDIGVGDALKALGDLAKAQPRSDASGSVYNLTHQMPPNLVTGMFEHVGKKVGVLSAYDAAEILESVRAAMADEEYAATRDDFGDGLWGALRKAHSWLMEKTPLVGKSFDEQELDARLEIAKKKYEELNQKVTHYPTLDAATKARAASGDASVLSEVDFELRPSVFRELAIWAEGQSQADVNALAHELMRGEDRYFHARWAEDMIATGAGPRLANELVERSPQGDRLRYIVAPGKQKAGQNAKDLHICQALAQDSCPSLRTKRGLGSDVSVERLMEVGGLTAFSKYTVSEEALIDGGIAEGWTERDWENTHRKIKHVYRERGIRGLELWGRLAKLKYTTVRDLFANEANDYDPYAEVGRFIDMMAPYLANGTEPSDDDLRELYNEVLKGYPMKLGYH